MSAHTPGPWTAYSMVHEATHKPMTPKQVGDYVRNSIKKSAKESGTTEFLIVSAEKPDGPADVCHVGNGPTSPANARLIAAAPELLKALKDMTADYALLCGDGVTADNETPQLSAARSLLARLEAR